MIGVSPAYFFSLHGPGFGPESIMEDLPVLSSMGYKGFQAEIFDAGVGSAWTKEAVRNLNGASRAAGMKCTAFVAHFLGSSFASRAALEEFSVDTAVRRAIEAAAGIEDNPVFALPMPAFNDPIGRQGAGDFIDKQLENALGSLIRAVEAEGMHLALEPMQGNALGGSAAFLKLCMVPGFEELGLVFDTGHFWVMGENVGSLPEVLADRIIATHLCDNDGMTKLSLCPGDSSVPFDRITDGFVVSGYKGSLDVEIVCPAVKVQAEYTRAVAQLRLMESRIARTPSKARSTIRSTP
jgi:sugar phosphate isomerase/epimerase